MSYSLKRCNNCKIEKPFDAFSKRKNGKFGLNGQCKICYNTRINIYRAKHPEVIKAIEERFRANNPDKIKLQNEMQYAKNQEKIKQQTRLYYHNNKEAMKKAHSVWRANNPEVVKFHSKNERHKRRALIGQSRITPQDWKNLCEWFGNQCLACGKPEVTMDHVVPLSKFGEHHIDNLQPLCISCNSTKGTKDTDYRTKESSSLCLTH